MSTFLLSSFLGRQILLKIAIIRFQSLFATPLLTVTNLCSRILVFLFVYYNPHDNLYLIVLILFTIFFCQIRLYYVKCHFEKNDKIGVMQKYFSKDLKICHTMHPYLEHSVLSRSVNIFNIICVHVMLVFLI